MNLIHTGNFDTFVRQQLIFQLWQEYLKLNQEKRKGLTAL